jgi:hypothetical protein
MPGATVGGATYNGKHRGDAHSGFVTSDTQTKNTNLFFARRITHGIYDTTSPVGLHQLH